MNHFDCLKRTSIKKRNLDFDYSRYYHKGRFDNTVNYDFFETENMKRFRAFNNKKHYNTDLIDLWAILDIKSYIDYDLGNTINPYFYNDLKNIPIKNTEDYNFMSDEQRKAELLDIKYIKKLTIYNIHFSKIFVSSFEIMDKEKMYRPYLLLHTLDKDNKFEQIRIWI